MKLREGIVYKVTNKNDGKVYIGQTVFSLKYRWNQHCHRGECSRLHKAIMRDGPDAFSIEVIERLTEDKLNERELFWIEALNSTDERYGYNIRKVKCRERKDPHKLSKEDELRIVELDCAGVTHMEIASMFGINRKTVTFIIKRIVPYENKRVKVSERKDLGKIIAYMTGDENPTAKQCRERFRIGSNTLFDLARKIGHHFLTSNERRSLRI